MSARFTPEAVRDTLTAAGYRERNPDSNTTGYQIADARDIRSEILVEPLTALADPPYTTAAERRAQTVLIQGCLGALQAAGYTALAASTTLIVIPEKGN
jgi:hypothetical protein